MEDERHTDTRLKSVGRRRDLDVFKTLLVAQMIACHVILIMLGNPSPVAIGLAAYINLMTFSGFMFAFGTGTALSAQQDHAPRPPVRSCKGPIKLLLGFYVSGYASLFLWQNQELTKGVVLEVLTLVQLPMVSEFLAAFFILSVIIALFKCRIVLIFSRRRYVLLAVAASALSACFHYGTFKLPWAALFIGDDQRTSFPLVPYGLWFVVGVHYGRRGTAIGPLAFIAATAATGLFGIFLISHGGEPARWPPSLLWVIGPALFLFLYRAASRTLDARVNLSDAVILPGQHVLLFLVASNVMIFALVRKQVILPGSLADCLALTATIIITTCLLQLAFDCALRRAQGVFKPPATLRLRAKSCPS